MVEYNLDEDEQEILQSFESGKLESVPNVEDEIKKHTQIAATTFKKDTDYNGFC